jgi:hypothetical protein
LACFIHGFAAFTETPKQRKTALAALPASARRDVFLSRGDLLAIVKFGRIKAGSSGNAPDTMAAQRHPGWSTMEALCALSRENVVTMTPVDAIDCVGVWLRPSGSVIVVPVGVDPGEVLRQVLRAAEEGSRASHVYLSRQEVYDLARHNAVVPVTRGYHYRHVERRYPGWSWDELYGALRRSGHLFRHDGQKAPSCHLPEGSVGALISRTGEVVLDDGSLEHPARGQSWARQYG